MSLMCFLYLDLIAFLFYRKCGHYSPNNPLGFISSGNVMLVTLVTNEVGDYPGFRAQVSQVTEASARGMNEDCEGAISSLVCTFHLPCYAYFIMHTLLNAVMGRKYFL